LGRFGSIGATNAYGVATRRPPLSPKTFAVLRCLVTQAGQLVTKDTLLEAVWPATVVSESILAVAIRTLRRVLGDQARTPRFIETMHDRGYRFLAPVSATMPPERSTIMEKPRHSLPPVVSPSPLFVGRDAELAQLAPWWTTVPQGQRQVGMIVGEPGIGKTALVETFVAQVSATEDVWVGHGQCMDHYEAGEAYLPVLEALGRLCRGPAGAPPNISNMRRIMPCSGVPIRRQSPISPKGWSTSSPCQTPRSVRNESWPCSSDLARPSS